MTRRRTRRARTAAMLGRAGFFLALLVPRAALAAGLGAHPLDWPSVEELLRVLTLQDYNTRVVIVGTTLLGLAAGLVGTFLLLRKRALLSDTLSHASLPGIALTFIVLTALGGEGKNLLALVSGAALFCILGTGAVIVIQRYSRLKDDAALGIVLSVFFGLGIALMGIATRMGSGNAAGLSSFIYGKTASMLFFDAVLIAVVALLAAACGLLFFKEFALVCFDADFAASQGWPVTRIDFLMMTLVVVVTVIGLQAVGLILVVALLIIPPAAARFWTYSLKHMLWIASLFGALSGLFGAGISALMANLPAGAVIVLTASLIFTLSLVCGTARGLARQGLERLRLSRRIRHENLLREVYEMLEVCGRDPAGGDMDCGLEQVGFEALLRRRSWSPGQLRRALRRAARAGWLVTEGGGWALTASGLEEAGRIVRKHRLWETYLIEHADVAPGHVDWGADAIEHVLDAGLVAELEKKLQPGEQPLPMPASPHRIPPLEEETA
ncbi:MAG: iron chelate uptake ABC transporter family permease subunit [Desulfobacterales bacterium]|nr:iron chelate uptake ABC transporter family permease subunit [Desulfobacterales bacterium]